jgi:hypothetical protein
MRLYKNRYFLTAGSFAVLVFIFLFMVRVDLFEKLLSRPKTLSIQSITSPEDKENWMSIFQNERRIGFSHSRFSVENDGYRLQETVHMRLNTMGMVQDIRLKTQTMLKADFSLNYFNFLINSGRFRFRVEGSVSGDIITIKSTSAGDTRTTDIKLKAKPYLLAGVTAAIAATDLKAGEKYVFDVFDPATLGQSPLMVKIIGKEDLEILGSRVTATKISLQLKGTSQVAWIGETGDVLREKGILGIHLEKTSRDDALSGPAVDSGSDLTQIASVASNIIIENPDRLSALIIEVDGLPLKSIKLNGGRQILNGKILTIKKESTANLAAEIRENNLGTLEKIYLKPTAFIQSDHQKIVTLAQKIAGNYSTPLNKIRALINWMNQNIEKRPVLSLPNALSTLENGVGDCNEHAVLMAALARAAGIPCRIEAGLVYLRGRFYYHAWNLVYLGRWITADALFGQVPADVTHIRLVTGSPRQQLDLMGIIGKIKLRIIE